MIVDGYSLSKCYSCDMWSLYVYHSVRLRMPFARFFVILHVGGRFSGFFDGGVAVVSLLLHASGSLQMRLALLGLWPVVVIVVGKSHSLCMNITRFVPPPPFRRMEKVAQQNFRASCSIVTEEVFLFFL